VTTVPELGACGCGGRLVVENPDDEHVWVGVCDRCGYEVGCPRQRIDPRIRRRRRLEQAGLPAEFSGRPFEDDEYNRDVAYACRSWVRDYAAWRAKRPTDPSAAYPAPPPAPGVYGDAGRGKSHLLVAVCRLLIHEADAAVLFRSARQLLRELQNFEHREAADQAWHRAITVDVLALDDVGAQQVTDWRHDQLADLIDERYQRRLPIVLATNFPPHLWEDVLDARSVSRLGALTAPIELAGPDRRQLAITQPQGGATP
jgi:hypothetical protein